MKLQSSMRMEINIEEFFSEASSMAMEFTIIKMAMSMMENGKTINRTGKAHIHIKMVIGLMGSGKKE